MLGVSVFLLPLVIAEFSDSEKTVAQYSIIYTLVCNSVYLVVYLRQRFRIGSPTPLVSALVMIGYFTWLPVLLLTAVGLIFEATLGILVAYGFWVLVSSPTIFVLFLYEFIHPGATDS